MLPPPPKNSQGSLLPPPPKKKEDTDLSSIQLEDGSPVGGGEAPSTEFKWSPNKTTNEIVQTEASVGPTPEPDKTMLPAYQEQEKQKKKEEYFTGLASRYLESIPDISEYTPSQLERLKSQALKMGIEPSYIDDALAGVKSLQSLKKGKELVAEKKKQVEENLKSGTGDYDIMPDPGAPSVKVEGIAPVEEVTPEMVNKRLENDAKYYAQQQFPEYGDLFVISDRIKTLQSKETLTEQEQGDLKNLLDNYYNLTGSTGLLFDPKTGNFVEEPNADTEKYQSDVITLAKGYEKTPMEKMGELFLQKKELLDYAEKQYFTQSDKGWTLYELDGLGANREALIASGIQPDKDGRYHLSPDEARAIGINAEDITVYRDNYINARKDFDAITQAYLLNIDPGKGDMGYVSYLESGIREGLKNSTIIGGVAEIFGFDATKMTDVQRLETYAKNAAEASVGLTETQQKELEQDLGETTMRAVGNSLPVMGDIAVVTAITRGAGAATGLSGAFKSMVDAATGKYGKIVGGAIDIIGTGLVTSAEFELAGAGGATGAGEGVAQGILGKLDILQKINGKYGTLIKTLIRTGAGGLGETFGEYAGEFTSALENNGFDWSKVIDDTFGKDLDEATKKGLATLITSLLFSGVSNAAVLTSGKEWLQNKNIPNKEELIADIDKAIVEEDIPSPKIESDALQTEETGQTGEAEVLTEEVTPVSEEVPAVTDVIDVEPIRERINNITTPDAATRLSEEIMLLEMPKEQRQQLIEEIAAKKEEIVSIPAEQEQKKLEQEKIARDEAINNYDGSVESAARVLETSDELIATRETYGDDVADFILDKFKGVDLQKKYGVFFDRLNTEADNILDYESPLTTVYDNLKEGNIEAVKSSMEPQMDILQKTINDLEPTWEENLRSLKLKLDDDKGVLFSNPVQLVWNGGIEAVILAIKGGAKVVDAVAAGIQYVSEKLKEQGVPEGDITKQLSEFETELNKMMVFPPKTAKQKQVEKNAGTITEKKKIVVDEMSELKRQIKMESRAAAQGFRQGVTDTKKAAKEFANKVSEIIKPLKSKLNASQIKALVSRAAKVSTERQLEKFQEYAEKVISDANYADNLEAVGKAIKQLKRSLKDRNSAKVKEIGRLDLSQLTAQEISELANVLAAANQKVPDTSLLEAYVVPVTTKKPKKPKTLAEYQEYKDDILGMEVNDLSDVRKVTRKFNSARAALRVMLEEGIITDAEYETEMEFLDEAQDLETSNFGAEVNNAKRQAIDNIQSNLRDNWDRDNFTEEENDFIAKLKSLTGDEIFDLNIGDIDALSDVTDRIANGTIPLDIATSIYGRAIGKARGAKIADQVNTAVDKGIVPKLTDVRKKLDRAEAQSVEDILNLGRGSSIYSYLYNIYNRAMAAAKKSNDALFQRYKDVAGGPGFGEKFLGRIGAKVPESIKRRTLEKAKVMMNRYQSMVRNTSGSVYGFEISSIDYFGLLLDNEAAYDALVPTDGNTDVEKSKQQIRDRMESQRTAYGMNRDGKINNMNQLDIIKEVYDSFPKNPDGTVNWENITLNPREQKIADVVNEIMEELRNKQRFANEAKGLPFEEQYDYLPTNWLMRDTDLNMDSQGGQKPGVRAGSSYVRTDFRPGALSINLDALVANAIKDTNNDYYMTNANMEVKPTIAYAKDGIRNKAIGPNITSIIKGDLENRKLFLESQASLWWLEKNLLKAGYIGSLVNFIPRVADVVSSLNRLVTFFSPKKVMKSIFSPLERRAFAKLMDITDSSLALKLSRRTDPNVTGEFDQPNTFERMTNAAIGIDEAINLVGAWMPNFKMEFASLAGETFDLQKFVSDPTYAEEFRREIEDAASYADRETKKLYGGGTRFEQRRYIQVMPFATGIKADTRAGIYAGYMGSFARRELEIFLQAMGDMITANNQNRTTAALRAFGVAQAGFMYGFIGSIGFAVKDILMGDDEEKKKAREELEQITSPDGILKEMGGSLAFLGLSKYGQAGRYASKLMLSIAYEASNDKDTKAQIKNFMKENLYTNPIIMSKMGLLASISELVPPASLAISNGLKMVYGGYGYGKNEDSFKKLWDKYQKKGFEGLTKSEQDRWALFSLLYNTMSFMASFWGYSAPFKNDLEKAIKTELKEADKKK